MFVLSRVVASTLIAVMISVLILPATVLAISFPVPGTPTLLTPVQGWSTIEKKSLITGLTQNNTEVAVYIDDVFNGRAQVRNGYQGTANFVYQPFLDLTPGWHTVKVKAQDDRSGLESASTLVRSFYVDLPLPAPTLITPVVNDETNWSKPWIVGLSKNDTVIHIYIDGVYNGKTKVVNHASGTANFTYQPFLNLTPGLHQVKVIAKDVQGKSSVVSQILDFTVKSQILITPIIDSAEVSTSQDANQVNQNESTSQDRNRTSSDSENKKEDEEKDLSETTGNSTIGWAMLVLIASGLVYRNRRSVKGFFKDDNQDGGTPSGGSDNSSSSRVEVITKKDDDNTPKSPPSASSY